MEIGIIRSVFLYSSTGIGWCMYAFLAGLLVYIGIVVPSFVGRIFGSNGDSKTFFQRQF